MGTSTIRHMAALATVAVLGLGACGGDSHKTVSAASSGRPAATASSSAAPSSSTTTVAMASSGPASSSDGTTTSPAPAATTPLETPPAAPGAASPPSPEPPPPPPPPTTAAPPTSTAAPPPPPPPPPPASGAISIKAFTFSPNPLRVGVGATVTTSNDETAVSHTWTSDSGAWDSGTLAPGASYTFTFASPGTFTYHCNIHASMTGSVVVS